MPVREIRRAVAADVEAAVGVWVRARWDALPWLEARMRYSPADNLRHFREVVMRENEVWLAVEGGVVVGFLAVGTRRIDHLYVDPGCQGRGVGAALLARAKELAPQGLSLYTHQRNHRARGFYERHGFRAVAFGLSPPPESEPDVTYVWDPGEDG